MSEPARPLPAEHPDPQAWAPTPAGPTAPDASPRAPRGTDLLAPAAPTVSAGTPAEGRPAEEAAGRRRRGGRGPGGLSPRPGQIPGLDGLRALAVAAVLVYHFLPASLPGGFLGVDVFFVVSGFLISTLLLRELDQDGRVNLPEFWRRRARRLLPALLVVVVVSTAAARLVGGDLLVGIVRQVLGALTFTTNWVEIAHGTSYFESTSPVLLINLWSLAVEEQFYLLWPATLVLLLALTRTPRQRVAAVAGLGLASALLMALLYRPGSDGTRVYYGTDTHLMGLMVGAALALAWADPAHRAGLRTATWRRWRGVIVLGALLVLAALMRWLGDDSAWTFRGGILLGSLASAVLVAGLLEADGPWRRLMTLPPLTWLGRRSYATYLWHWPVLLVVTALLPWAPGTVRGTVVLLVVASLTLLLAEASLRLVETPVRRHGLRASLAELARWLRTPWGVDRTPRLVGAGMAVAVLAVAVALVTAPEMSRTQRQIQASERELARQGVTGTAGTPAGAEASASTATPAGTGSRRSSDAASGTSARRGSRGGVDVNGAIFHRDDEKFLVPSGSTITAIGDSMVVTSADGMTARFPGTAYLARSNRQWAEGLTVLTQAVREGTVRKNVVLDLGTNGGVDPDALRSALEALGPHRNVVVMDLYVTASFTESSNAALREVVADFPNAVVGEWAAAASAHPEQLQSDRTHPDIAGMHLYAHVVAEAFDALARRG